MATTPSKGDPDVAHADDFHPTSLPTTRRGRSRLARLWQFPLLVASLGLFGYAGYRLIDPKAKPTIDDRLASADTLLTNDRPEPATEVLRALLVEDEKRLSPEQRARVHIYLARAVEQIQKARKLEVPTNYERIIEYSKVAQANGMVLDAAAHRRVAESYEALGKTAEAAEAYGKAIAADPDKSLGLRRKLIDLLVARKETDAAEGQLVAYLTDPRLSPGERAWALGERSRILADRGRFADAVGLLDEAIRNEQDPSLLGQLHYRVGYCQHRLGNDAEAARYLRLARDQLKVRHPQDADAALLLGQILLRQGKHREAMAFFQDVIASHPESPAATPARLGRGEARVAIREDDAGLTDLHEVCTDVNEHPTRWRFKADAEGAVRRSGKTLADRGNLAGAIELMALEQTLDAHPSAEFFGRLSGLYERRAKQVESADAVGEAAIAKRDQQVRDLLRRAGDAAIAQSRGLTVTDDRGYGEALWRGVELFDAAGEAPRVIAALETFVAERPGDPLTPDAILRLGRARHAAGQFDLAIAAFQRNQLNHPRSLAASRSGVPLAQAYIAKGPAFYAKAEAALRATMESDLLTPDAEEFRLALFELAQLQYRTGKYEDAIQQLSELTDRYPGDARNGQILFLMADSYRKSAELLAAADRSRPPAAAGTAPDVAAVAERSAARRDRLLRARRLYDRVIDRARDLEGRAAPVAGDLDKLYLKLAHFYRADCVYDVGLYEEAVKLYDAAALRYQDDPSALAAYVQIVNAYAALGRPGDARAANERARWLLQRMPPSAFKEARLTMPQKSWDDWVQWSKTAGLWSGDAP